MSTKQITPPSSLPSIDANGQRRFVTRFVFWILGALPTLAVLVALGAIGYWGHHSEWKIPKFSELTSKVEVEGVEWCDEHGVPEAECIACNAELMPKQTLHGWCKEHGVHECILHQPDLAQLSETSELSQADLDRATRAIVLRPRRKNDPACKMHLRRIQFSSMAAADKAGIDIGLVDRGPVVETVSATGEIVYDPTRVARLASRAAGTVWRVDKNVGDRVQAGEVLALVDAAEVGKEKSELLDALTQVEFHTTTINRLAPLSKSKAISDKRLLEAQTAQRQANIRLRRSEQALNNLGLPVSIDRLIRMSDAERATHIRFLGLPEQTRSKMSASVTSNNLIPLVASLDGVVTKREAVVGEVIEPSQVLFQIVDISRMWLMLNVPLEEAKYLVAGQKVIFRPDADDHGYSGQLTWISTDVDGQTRTIKVRGELPNENGHLRNESFGKGEIVLREEDDAILVPSSVVHWEGCCHVVFVRDKNFMKEGSYKVFHTRSVRPGVTVGDHTEMIAGVLPGEVVVTKGSGVLRAELLKGNLGAG